MIAASAVKLTDFNAVAVRAYDRGSRYAFDCAAEGESALAADAMRQCMTVAAFAAEAITAKVSAGYPQNAELIFDMNAWDRLQLCAALAAFVYDVKHVVMEVR